MKIIIKEDKQIGTETIMITCANREQAEMIQNVLQQSQLPTLKLFGLLDGKEYRLQLKEILFFETSEEVVWAHTKSHQFEMKERLYELEKILPHMFMRISKSTILHIPMLNTIESSIGGPRQITFRATEKTVYVSRKYYPLLKEQIS